MDNTICQKCRIPFDEDDDIVYCPSCKRHYHEECWRENGGCVGEECKYHYEKINDTYETEIEDNSFDEIGKSEKTAEYEIPRIIKNEKIIAQTNFVDKARSIATAFLICCITFFVSSITMMILLITVEEDVFGLLFTIFGFVFFIFAFLFMIFYYKSVKVTVTTKKVLFETMLGACISVPLDLISGVLYKGSILFVIKSPSNKVKVLFHKQSKKYFDAVNAIILNRPSNVI